MAKKHAVMQRNAKAAARCIGCHTIEIIIHVFVTNAGDDSASLITPAIVANEIKILNEAFSSSAFKFHLNQTKFVVNDEWALSDPNEDEGGKAIQDAIVSANRIGGGDVCNVFYSDGVCTSLLGFATLPGTTTQIMYPVNEFSKTTVFLFVRRKSLSQRRLFLPLLSLTRLGTGWVW